MTAIVSNYIIPIIQDLSTMGQIFLWMSFFLWGMIVVLNIMCAYVLIHLSPETIQILPNPVLYSILYPVPIAALITYAYLFYTTYSKLKSSGESFDFAVINAQIYAKSKLPGIIENLI